MTFLLDSFWVLQAVCVSDELIKITRVTLELARSLGVRRDELSATARLSRAQLIARNFDEGLAAAREVTEGAIELGDLEFELDGRKLACDALQTLNEGQAAKDEAERALALRRRIGGDDSGELYALGSSLLIAEEYEQAARWLERAKEGFERIPDRENAAIATFQLGSTRVKLGDHDDAVALFGEALAVFVELGRLRLEANLLEEFGTLRLNQGSPELGREMLTRAAVLFRELGDAQAVARVLNALEEYDDR